MAVLPRGSRARRPWKWAPGHPVRGVNLGNWLVLERWMDKGAEAPFAGADADDEHGLRRELDADELTRRLEAHRARYVTADTFAWLADVGCTMVRLPIPYHVFGDKAHEGCAEHVDAALDWADERGIPVLLDLHTVPGGQNGFDNSGVSGLCTWHLSSAQVATTLDVLERIARRWGAHLALFGIEPMNEPASPRIFSSSMERYGAGHPGRVERSAPIPRTVLRQFYRLAYERIRPVTGAGVALVLHDQFQLGAWARFMPADRFPNVWIDTHQYLGTFCRAARATTLRAHQAVARGVGARIALAERSHPVLVGEWSLAHNMGGLADQGTERRDEALRAYAQAQLAAFERGRGSCFWSLRGSRDTWSLEAAVRRGWLNLRA